MEPNVIAALLAQGVTIEQIAIMAAKKPAASGNADTASIRSAPLPINRGQTLSHPKGAPYVTGQPGTFDGDYAITLTGFAYKGTDKGKLFEVSFQIDESTNPLVPVGSTRQHEIWQNTPAGKSEANGMMQCLFTAAGHAGSWTDEFFTAATGEGQTAKGLRFHLGVNTRPQKQDPRKCFTDHRYTPIESGQALGLATAAAPAPAPAVAGPAAMPSGLPTQAPPGWEATGLPWPPV